MITSLGKYAVNFIALLFCIVFLPTPARSETIGVIVTRNSKIFERAHGAFLSYLSEKGFSKRLNFITQNPYPDPIAWSNASRKLIALDVDVIVTYGAAATFSVLRERTNIPVIYSSVYEPATANIRSKNVTGVCTKYSISSLLRYLRAADSLQNLGAVYCSMEEDSKMQFNELKNLASKYGFKLTGLNIKKAANASTALTEANVSALFITSSSVIASVYPNVLRIANSKRIPTASFIMHDEMFPTILLSPDPEEIGREAARKLIDYLKGKPINKIPVTCSKNIDIVFNLKDAQALGIKIPMNLVTEATRIIK
jgi:putative ABC transport system substrate-binding protein